MGRHSYNYVYFCEGESERSLVNCLIKEGLLESGTIVKENPAGKSLKNLAITYPKGTKFIFVFDTDDIDRLEPLQKNISALREYGDVWLIPQVDNFEDEIVYSTDLNNPFELFTRCNNLSAFKHNVNRLYVKPSEFYKKLSNCGFNFEKLWSRLPRTSFRSIVPRNDSHKIRLIQSKNKPRKQISKLKLK